MRHAPGRAGSPHPAHRLAITGSSQQRLSGQALTLNDRQLLENAVPRSMPPIIRSHASISGSPERCGRASGRAPAARRTSSGSTGLAQQSHRRARSPASQHPTSGRCSTLVLFSDLTQNRSEVSLRGDLNAHSLRQARVHANPLLLTEQAQWCRSQSQYARYRRPSRRTDISFMRSAITNWSA